MCGRLNVNDNAGMKKLSSQLNIKYWQAPLQEGRFIRATNPVTIVHEHNSQRIADSAIWWLLLDKTDTGFKPSKYTSFNTRYDKLNTRGSAGYKAFRENRCIIPASGFGETEFESKKPKHYFDFEALDSEAIAFGGLYREWFHPGTGKVTKSCSIITLPPHEKLKHFHSKAMPLMLNQNDDSINMWLDKSLTDSEALNELLLPNIPQELIAYQIDKPSSFQPIDAARTILKD